MHNKTSYSRFLVLIKDKPWSVYYLSNTVHDPREPMTSPFRPAKDEGGLSGLTSSPRTVAHTFRNLDGVPAGRAAGCFLLEAEREFWRSLWATKETLWRQDVEKGVMKFTGITITMPAEEKVWGAKRKYRKCFPSPGPIPQVQSKKLLDTQRDSCQARKCSK